MKLKDKYTNSKENDPKKIKLSNESYAVCEFLESLSREIFKLRTSTNG